VLVGSDRVTVTSQGGTQSSDSEQAGNAGQGGSNSGQDSMTAGGMPDMPTVGDPTSSPTPSGNSATGTDPMENIGDGVLGADAGSPDQASDGGTLSNDQSANDQPAGNNTGGTSAGTDTNAAGTGTEPP
jgi:hypothetical protein